MFFSLGPSPLMKAYASTVRKYAVGEGRAGRQEVLAFVMANAIFGALIWAVAGAAAWIIAAGYVASVLVPSVALGVRRMHDLGKSGWWFAMPGYGLALAFFPGEKSVNRFGPVPPAILPCGRCSRPVRFGRFPKPAKGSTIVFPVRRGADGKVVEVLLAMKKRGFGAGWWNGAGGKLQAGETFEQAAARETAEEVGITPTRLSKVMEVSFFFPHKPAWDQTTHVFLCEAWTGEPSESEEMKPAWFALADIPFKQMWPSDDLWIPRVLAGGVLESRIVFDENNAAVDVDIRRADAD